MPRVAVFAALAFAEVLTAVIADELTGLANRRLIMTRLDRIVALTYTGDHLLVKDARDPEVIEQRDSTRCKWVEFRCLKTRATATHLWFWLSVPG
jgi:hypothetical protein